jgi:hypothetical protein
LRKLDPTKTEKMTELGSPLKLDPSTSKRRKLSLILEKCAICQKAVVKQLFHLRIAVNHGFLMRNYHHNLKFEQTTFKSQKNKDTSTNTKAINQ